MTTRIPHFSPLEQLLYDIFEIVESANPVPLEERARQILAAPELPHKPKHSGSRSVYVDGVLISQQDRESSSEQVK